MEKKENRQELIQKFKVVIVQNGAVKMCGVVDTEQEAIDMVQNLRVFKNINAVYAPFCMGVKK